MLSGMEEVGTGLLDRLDAMQRVAASAPGGPLLIVAGPGTGKTRTLTHRIAYLCAELNVFPEHCLAITFTRRAAEELRHRLDGLLGPVAEDVTVGTFHALGLTILRENADAAGLPADFRIADDAERAAGPRARPATTAPATSALLRKQDLVDLDELVTLPVELLRADRKLVERVPGPLAVDLRRRVPGRRRGAVRAAAAAQPGRRQPLRDRRPGPGDLLVPGRRRRLLPALLRGLHGRPVGAAQPQLPLVGADPGRRRAGHRAVLAGPRPATGPGPARPGGAAGRALPGGVGRRGGRLRGPYRRRAGRRPVPPLAGLGPASTAGRTSLSFSDIAVLYRTDAQAAPIVDALTRASIPVQKRSHDRLRDRPGVAAIARELRHADGLAGSLAARVRLAGQVVAERFAVPTLDGAAARSARSDVRSAVDLLTPLARRCGDDLETFLSQLATGAEVDALDPRAEAVTLLTLHAAKGLEFPVVFLVGCRGRAAAAALAGLDARRGRGRRGAPALLRRPDPRPGPAVRQPRRPPDPARRGAGLRPVAVPRRHRPRPVRAVRRGRAAPPEGPPAPVDLTIARRPGHWRAAPVVVLVDAPCPVRSCRDATQPGRGSAGQPTSTPSQAPASRAGPSGSSVSRRTRRAASRPSTRATVQHMRQDQPGQQGVPAQPAKRQAEDGGEFHVPEAQPGAGQQGQQHVRRARRPPRRPARRAAGPGSPAQQRRAGQAAEGQQPGGEDQRVGQPQAGQVDPRQHQTDRRDREEDRQRRVVTHGDGKADKDAGRHHRADRRTADRAAQDAPGPGVRWRSAGPAGGTTRPTSAPSSATATSAAADMGRTLLSVAHRRGPRS